MMFYLYYLSQGPNAIAGGFNVFQYVSFRAVCAAITAFLLCLVFGNWVIRKLIIAQIRSADPYRGRGSPALRTPWSQKGHANHGRSVFHGVGRGFHHHLGPAG